MQMRIGFGNFIIDEWLKLYKNMNSYTSGKQRWGKGSAKLNRNIYKYLSQFIWCPCFFLVARSIIIRLVPTLFSRFATNYNSSGSRASFSCVVNYTSSNSRASFHLVPTLLSHDAVSYNSSCPHTAFSWRGQLQFIWYPCFFLMPRSIYKFIWYQCFFPMTLSITIYLIPTLLSNVMVNYNSSGSHASFPWRGQLTNSSGTNASFPWRCPLQFIWYPRFFLMSWSITIRLVPTLLSHGDVNLQIHLVPMLLSHDAVHYNLSDTHASF